MLSRYMLSSVVILVSIVGLKSSLANDYLQAQSEFESYKNQIDNDFSDYKKELQKAFSVYKNKTEKVWGKNNSPISDKKKWVSYQGDLNHRSIVDFEKGTVKVEIAIPVKKPVKDQDVQDDLKKTIDDTLLLGADNRSVIDISKQPVSIPSGDVVLKDLIDKEEIKIDELVSKPDRKIVTGKDGKSRYIYTVTFKMVPDHIRKRAEKYRLEVDKNARKQKIPSALIFAVIETESMFNPTARSHSPAFGLMQLVPTTGARDAYRYLYNKDRVVSDSYLYNPENNIRLGSAYLNRLYYAYFKSVKNEQSRQWVSIAAYNTGMGNVYSAFVGRYSKARFGSGKKWKQKAFDEINRRTPEQVYQFLRKNLTKAEARQYVKKVRQRMPKYQQS